MLIGSSLCCKAPKAKFVGANLRTSSLPEDMVSAVFRQATLGEFGPGDDEQGRLRRSEDRRSALDIPESARRELLSGQLPRQMMIDNSDFSGAI